MVPVREKNPPEKFDLERYSWLNTLWSLRSTFLRSTILGIVLGIVIAVFQPGEFTSETVILPEYARSIGYAGNVLDSRIGSILTSISTSTYRGRTDAIRIDLYPALMKSNLVLSNVLERTMDISVNGVTDPGFAETRLLDYLNESQRTSLPTFLRRNVMGGPSIVADLFQKDRRTLPLTEIAKLRNDPTFFIPTHDKLYALNELREQILVTFDEQTGAFRMSVTMSNPVVSAIVAQMVLRETHNLITEYQQEKFRMDYQLLETEMMRAKSVMDQERLELANFLDRNTNAYSAEQQSVLFEKEYDFNLANNIYRSYLFQTEESRLKSEEETPLFTYLSPTSVPTDANLSTFWDTIGIIMLFVYAIAGTRLLFLRFAHTLK